MITKFHTLLDHTENILWGYIAIPLILIFGTLLTIKLNFPQITKFKTATKVFFQSIFAKQEKNKVKLGISPIRAFFTSIGGCIGVANLVGVCTAVKVGGPGAVFWMWVSAFFGMSIKYSEVYLGVKFRKKNNQGSYDGGPMYYLQKAFKSKLIPILITFLLAFYGVEIYMFSLIVDTIKTNWNINIYVVIVVLLGSILYVVRGGVDRVGRISSFIIPLFLVIYVFMSLWILGHNSSKILPTFKLIFKSAFTGHGAIGGFAGSSILLTMSQGMARGCYSGDIGIGYASIVHAESSHSDPEKQSNLSILGIYLDTFVICTLTTLLILVTDTWKGNYSESEMTQVVLSNYFPYMNVFIPLFLLIVGYSSILAFFVVGLKCAHYISPKWGKKIYYVYGTVSLIIFSFIPTNLVYTIMAICGGLLLVFNVIGIYKIKKDLK